MTQTAPQAVQMSGIHHVAFRCRDAEQTRWFYSDVLGLKAAAGIVLETVPGTHADTPYMHIFFELGDGNYIAFFDSPTDADPAWFDKKNSFDMHVAITADTRDDMLTMQKRIEANGVRCFGPIEHDFVESVYMYDPNGIQVEITAKTPKHDEILFEEGESLPETLARWAERTRAMKEAKFGAGAIDKRGTTSPAPALAQAN